MANSGVYVMECQGRYKIGVSNCVSKRLEKLNGASPFKVELVDVFPTSAPYPLEKHLHQGFSAQNIKGEWFMLDLQDLERLRQMVRVFAVSKQLSFDLQVRDAKIKPSKEDLEEFWICPLCNFLTRHLGICDQCQKEWIESVMCHIVQSPLNERRRIQNG